MINELKFSLAERLQFIGDVPLPSIVELNITPICNRTCDFCPRGHGWRDPGKPMTLSNLEKITTELSDLGFEGVIDIAGFSEPLLHPQHYEVMTMLSKGKWCTMLTTNGDFLKDKKQVELYDKVLVSMYDGPHQKEKFEKILDGMHFELVERYNNHFTELTNRAGYLQTIRTIDVNRRCNYLMYNLFITHNGDVIICSHNWNLSQVLGNVFESGIWNVWTNDNMKQYRTVLMNNRKISPCNKCDVNGTMIGDKHMLAWANKKS